MDDLTLAYWDVINDFETLTSPIKSYVGTLHVSPRGVAAVFEQAIAEGRYD